MNCWTFLALLVAVCAVFLGVGHTEETAEIDDFKEQVSQPNDPDHENEELAGSFENPESNVDDDKPAHAPADKESDPSSLAETDNVLESVSETASNDEDEPAKFKRAPWRRRLIRVRRIRVRVRRIVEKVCKWVYLTPHIGWKYKCHLAQKLLGDEESPLANSDDKASKEATWLDEE